MSKLNHLAQAVALSGSMLLVGSAAQAQLPVFGDGLASAGVDPAQYADNIYSRLAGRAVGFAFVIAENGQLAEQGQGGFARIPIFDGAKAFTVHTDVNVYSVSKTITAIAMLQLMDELSVDPHDPIGDWLPPGWDKGLGFGDDGMSFFDLLTHRTGINQTIALLGEEDEAFSALSTNTYAGVKAIVEHGIYPEFAGTGPVGYGPYSYKNANYKLAAVLIWQMALETGDITSNGELSADVDSAAGYQHYVRKNVLQAAGVDGFCSATGPAQGHALAYDTDQNIFPLIFTEGGSMGGSMYTCGPKNWWLSAMDVAAVAAHLRFGDLLSDESRAMMDDLKMGWSQSSDKGSNADRFWHGGLGKWTRSNRVQLLHPAHPLNPTPGFLARTVRARDRVQSCVMKLTGGIDATLVINSGVRTTGSSACGVLLGAFEDSL